MSHVSQTNILESFPGFLKGIGHIVGSLLASFSAQTWHTAILLPACLAHFAFRALPTGTLSGSQSSVQTGSMVVMSTAGTEEQVTQLPWPLTYCTASLLCRRKGRGVQISYGTMQSWYAYYSRLCRYQSICIQAHRQSPCTRKVVIYFTGTK